MDNGGKHTKGERCMILTSDDLIVPSAGPSIKVS